MKLISCLSRCRVVIQSVDFRFGEEPLVAKNVSFEVPAGAFIEIVGRSSGKSTIMKLLPRLYEPEKGRILIDGYDLASFN